jgi:hypothetical protein
LKLWTERSKMKAAARLVVLYRGRLSPLNPGACKATEAEVIAAMNELDDYLTDLAPLAGDPLAVIPSRFMKVLARRVDTLALRRGAGMDPPNRRPGC